MGTVTTRMWEARLVPGRLEEGLAWVLADVVSSARACGADSVEVCASSGLDDPRIVVITRWSDTTNWTEPPAPVQFVARFHAWPFEQVATYPQV